MAVSDIFFWSLHRSAELWGKTILANVSTNLPQPRYLSTEFLWLQPHINTSSFLCLLNKGSTEPHYLPKAAPNQSQTCLGEGRGDTPSAQPCAGSPKVELQEELPKHSQSCQQRAAATRSWSIPARLAHIALVCCHQLGCSFPNSSGFGRVTLQGENPLSTLQCLLLQPPSHKNLSYKDRLGEQGWFILEKSQSLPVRPHCSLAVLKGGLEKRRAHFTQADRDRTHFQRAGMDGWILA